LPNFFVIGAPKSGTTALHGALIQHPDIFMPTLKEPHFFSTRPDGPRRPPTRRPRRVRKDVRITEPGEYLALFARADAHRAIGEASVNYLRSPVAPARIRKDVPHAKIVAVLRHPVERAHSSYWFSVTRGLERAPSFEQALAQEWSNTRPVWWLTHYRFGLYHAQLSAYFALFPREQIRIYLYEDWRHRPEETLRDLFGFLDVDPDFHPAVPDVVVTRAPRSRRLHRLAQTVWLPGLDGFNLRHNLAAPPAMHPDTWLALHADYRDDITQLQTLIGRDLSHWLDPTRPDPRAQLGVAR
jgi:hypothetical protein